MILNFILVTLSLTNYIENCTKILITECNPFFNFKNEGILVGLNDLPSN